MAEPKAFASLSSGLLARKGAARPAMRPQGFGQVGSGLDDLGWNDMGFEAPKPVLAQVRDDDHDAFGDELPEPALRNPLAALSPVVSPVHDQQAEIADRFGSYAEQSPDEDDYVDETAELYDPNALEVGGDGDDEEDEEDEPEQGEVVPLIQTKAARPAPVVAQIVADPVALAPVVAQPVAEVVADVVTLVAIAEPAFVAPAFEPVVVVPLSKLARQPRAAPGNKAAFTLRLDGDRHLRLRLACAVNGRSAQQLVTHALDQLLGSMPELAGMAEQASKKRQ